MLKHCVYAVVAIGSPERKARKAVTVNNSRDKRS